MFLRFQGFEVSRIKVLRFLGTKISGFQGTNVLGFEDFQIHNLKTLKI
jgi:hypothetical protein